MRRPQYQSAHRPFFPTLDRQAIHIVTVEEFTFPVLPPASPGRGTSSTTLLLKGDRAMNRRAMCLLTGLAILFLGVGSMTAEDKGKSEPKIDPKREPDAKAIRKLGQDYVAAYEKGDAKACASFWTNEGEFIGEDGHVTEGRAAI